MRDEQPGTVAASAFERFFATASDLLSIADTDGFFRHVNPAWEKVLGWTPKELCGRPYIEWVHPDDIEETAAATAALRRGEAVKRFANRYAVKGGGWRELEWTATLDDVSGLIHATARDAAAARSAQLRADETEEISGVGSWEIDVVRSRMYWSPRTCAIHGVERGHVPSVKESLNFYAKAGLALLKPAYARLLKEGAPFDLELPFVTARGNARSVRVTGAAECRNGLVVRVYGTVQDVTDQRRERLHLRRLAALAENTVNAVIMTDAAGRVEWINQPCERITGFSLGEMLGKQPGDLLQCDETDPDTVAQIAVALAAERPVKVEILNRAKTGRRYWIEMEILPLRSDDAGVLDGFVAIQTDISERKRAEKIQARAVRLGRMVEESLNEVFVFDAETLRFLEVNRGARENLGYSIDDLRTMTPVDIKPDIDEAAFAAAIAPLRDGTLELLAFKTSHRRRDGSTYTADIRVQMMRGARSVFVAMVRDVTEQEAANAALIAAREQAEEASRAKSAFLANMSHEIRTPMNGVLGMAAVLETALTKPENRRMIGIIRESGALLLGLINDILDLSKIEAGKVELESAPFVPANFMRKIEAAFTLKAAEKSLSFRIFVHGDATGHRLGDEGRLLQIAHNLLGNAVKFTEKGEVIVELDCRAPETIGLTVRDTGIGMTPDQLSRIFDEFAQADVSTTRRFGGSGLGMAIVKKLTELMGGEIAIDSAAGRGTAVKLCLPLPWSASSAVEPQAPAVLPSDMSLPKMRLLAAEDNDVNRMVLEAMLQQLGQRADFVVNGAEAVEACRDTVYDALLLDISMPVMDGREALARIRALPGGSRAAPAIAVTASALSHEVDLLMHSGFAGHVPKPIAFDALGAALGRLGAQILLAPVVDSASSPGAEASPHDASGNCD